MPCRMNYSNTTTALRRGMLEPFDDRTLSYNNKIRSHFIGRHRLDALIDINEEKRIQSGAIKLFTPMSLWILFNFINYDILSQWNLFSKFISIKSEFQFNKNLNVTYLRNIYNDSLWLLWTSWLKNCDVLHLFLNLELYDQIREANYSGVTILWQR